MNNYTKKHEAYGNLLSSISTLITDNEECLSDHELQRLWRLWIEVTGISNSNTGDDAITLYDNFYIPKLIHSRVKKYCDEHNITEDQYDGIFGQQTMKFKIDPSLSMPKRKGNYNPDSGEFLKRNSNLKQNLVATMKVPPRRMPLYLDGTFANDNNYITYLYTVAKTHAGVDKYEHTWINHVNNNHEFIVNYVISICNELAIITKYASGNVIIAGDWAFSDIAEATTRTLSKANVMIDDANGKWFEMPITRVKVYNSQYVKPKDVFIGYTPNKNEITLELNNLISAHIIKATL